MYPEIIERIIDAIIGAVSGILGALFALWVSLRQLRLEQKRLALEQKRQEEETQRLRAEVAKIQAETQEILRRSNEQRRQRLTGLRDRLDVFERQSPEDPIGMFAALRQLRQSIEESIVFLPQDLREFLPKLVDDLRGIETEVRASYHEIEQLVKEQENVLGKPYGERRRIAQEQLGYDYWRVCKFLEKVRSEINPQLAILREKIKQTQ